MSKRLVFPKEFISRAEKYDFSDDGTNFRGYLYKGRLPITYAAIGSDRFICIRADYFGIPYEVYRRDMHILERYNYIDIDKIDMNQFIQDCEYAYQKYVVSSDANKAKLDELKKKELELSIQINELNKQLNAITEERRNIYSVA